MADLTELQSTQGVKIAGADSTGNETNWVNADANGNLKTIMTSAGSVAAGIAATNSNLIGGVYNTSLPTLTTGQQAAIQLDSSGRLITAPQTVTVGIADKTAFTYGTSSDLIIGGVYQDTSPTLTAGQSGAVRLTSNRALHINLRDSSGNEKLGSSLSAASIPVVIASDQAAISTQDILNVSGQYRAQSVTTTAAEALGGATILANRKMLSITPTNGTVYWGLSNAVTTTTGSPIFKNQTMTFSFGVNNHVYLIAASTTDCRIVEGS